MNTRLLSILFCMFFLACARDGKQDAHKFNGSYSGACIDRIAFPLGGMGAGMFCVEGNGCFSEFSLRHKPDVGNKPMIFAAISVKGKKNAAKIIEGTVQPWRIFGVPGAGNGGGFMGCPRFSNAEFSSRFPFANISLKDEKMPLNVSLNAWSPFIPGDADNSSLPVAGLEYTFTNPTSEKLDAVFSFHSENFMQVWVPNEYKWIGAKDSVMSMSHGFILEQYCQPEHPEYKGEFAVYTDAADAVIDYCWFRGGWFDARTLLWDDVAKCNMPADSVTKGSKGASMYVPVNLKPGESKTVRVMIAWHVPHSDQRVGMDPDNTPPVKKPDAKTCVPGSGCCSSEITSQYYEPWYYEKFKDVREIATYWHLNYEELKKKTELFTKTFYSSDLPPVVLEAVAANLSILKSPTVLRQKDGRLWGWEGCGDTWGCCNGSCTHVWNYAQSISNLFPSLERTLRETEFNLDQDSTGHQNFRANLPIRKPAHNFHAAADGQLGGIMKTYREWRISGNNDWLKEIWPLVRKSMDYAINHWDPRHKGVIEEPHHNTYDIEFWGPDGMHTSFYLGALNAAIKMGTFMGEDVKLYQELYDKGKAFMEKDLFNGEYFFQKIVTQGLNAEDPVTASKKSIGGTFYSEEGKKLLEAEGPKYQYGTGCLSDGVLGSWISDMCGVDAGIDPAKIKSHLLSVYQYNFRSDLSDHSNTQRPSYAYGKEGGLLICTWPKGGALTLPFPYSNEVWTGIEYQVASHLMMNGEVEKGLDIVKALRNRYDGRIRNPYNEYECGHWYARAMSSYGLIQGLTGIFFDAVDKTMYIDSKIGNDFKCFFSCETGYGLVGLKNGKPFADAVSGTIPVNKYIVAGKEISIGK
jgi:uncharacterized protein (DUF608 family)